MLQGGGESGDNVGRAIAAGKDVTGDGVEDLLIGAHFMGNGGGAYLIKGGSNIGTTFFGSGSAFDLTTLTATNGIIFEGQTSGGNAGWSVALAGNMGGEFGNSLGDILIGEPNTNSNQGKLFMIAGDSTLLSPYKLLVGGEQGGGNDYINSSSPAGFRAVNLYDYSAYGSSRYAFNRTGYSVAALDIDGDSYADVAIGAPITSSFSENEETYLVMPRTTVLYGASALYSDSYGGTWPIEQAFMNGEPDNYGFLVGGGKEISGGGNTNRQIGRTLAAGDVNGDGVDDLIIGIGDGVWNSGAESSQSGAIVVFGNNAGSISVPSTFPVTNFSDGFKIAGTSSINVSYNVAVLGDVNGDGVGDFAVAEYYDFATDRNATVYVIFGKSNLAGEEFDIGYDTLNGTNGFTISTPTNVYQGVSSLAGVDLNGDNINDIIIGLSGAEQGITDMAHVLFGASDIGSGGSVTLTSPMSASAGFTVTGPSVDNARKIAIGDLNGDGAKDVAIGSYGENSNDGKVYVIFGLKAGEAFPE